MLPPQTAKSKPKSAGQDKAEAVSNEETNIRAYMELLRTDVRKQKSEIVALVMAFDADQAAKFWPIYKEFEKDYTVLGDRIVALIRDYAEHFAALTGDQADQLANQILSIEQERNTLKKKYYDRVKEGVGAVTALRFLQVENQLERVIDLQISSQLPVIE
jgi:hypothetical protein